MIVNPMISGGVKLPALDDPGTAADLLAGKQLVDQYGKPLTGTMPKRSGGDLSASGAAVTVPAGYYPEQVSKSVAAAAQATPGISVSSNGLITASATQGEGYVAAGTKSATRQLTTQAGTTVTPGTGLKTAVASGRYTTGPVYVAGDANLVAGNIKSGVSIFGVAGTMEAKQDVPISIYASSGYGFTLLCIYQGEVSSSAWSSGTHEKLFTMPVGSFFELGVVSGLTVTGSSNLYIKKISPGDPNPTYYGVIIKSYSPSTYVRF